MWQSLADELNRHGFEVLAVALDTAEAARPWIEAARPTYRCLIDADHHVAALYNLVNVPQAVWIDEAARIVRPPEAAGSSDAFRTMDRTTGAMTEAALAERERVKTGYLAAVRDWAVRGAASAHALGTERVAARLAPPGDAVAEAHARFRLGLHLQRLGRDAEARAEFDSATRLHPDSWAMWRQVAQKNARGLAAGAEFWARVDALGARPYYPLADMVAPGS